MIRIEPRTSFNAVWNESNIHLKHEQDSFLLNSITKIKDFILYIPNSIIAACFNPRCESEFYSSDIATATLRSFSKQIITPDNVHLHAHVTLRQDATSDTPTTILFNPLGTNYDIHYGLKKRLLGKKCNIISFDYRGLGTTHRPQDLVIDGESVYQYAINELGINKNKVNFFGYSLGGAIGVQVKALHPDCTGKYAGDRTFLSVYNLITEFFCIEKLGPLIKKITSFIAAIFIAMPIYFIGWEYDNARAISQMNGEKRLVYHPNDLIVPFEASLARQCSSADQIRLYEEETGLTTHFTPIDEHNTSNGLNAADVIADFLSR